MSSRKQSNKPDLRAFVLWQRENLPLTQIAKRLGVPLREARRLIRSAAFVIRRARYSNRARSD